MLLQNPLYTLLDRTIQEYNDENLRTSAQQTYKSYDKQKGDEMSFYFWDIQSELKTNGGIISSQRKYEGMLEFTYNKKYDILTILQTPYIVKSDMKIPALTGDITSIIKQKLEKFTPTKSTFVKLPSETFLAVIDEQAKQQFPALSGTKNCKLIEKISRSIKLEEEKIRREVLAEKQAKDRHDAKIESLLSKKRSMFGIDPAAYSMEEFDKIISPKIVEYCENKIANIDRHLRANIKAYQDLMVKYDHEIEIFGKHSFSLLTEEDYEEIINNDNNDPRGTNESCKVILLYDLYGGWSLLRAIKDNFEDVNWEIKPYRYPNPFQSWEYFWECVLKNSRTWNPVFGSGNKDLDDFTKCADLLYNISSLKEQRKLYQSMLNNPAQILPEFLRANNQTSILMQCPYFIKYNRRTNHYFKKPIYATFMIKPGVKKIDYDKIRYTAGKNANEFGRWKFDRRKFLKGLVEGKSINNVDHMITFVPKSLPFDEIKKLVEYTLNHTLGKIDGSSGLEFNSIYDNGNQYFVCETPDVYLTVKTLLVQKELEFIKYTSFFHHGCFVMIEPDYYNKYFINTPAGYNYIEKFKKAGTRSPFTYGDSIRDCILNQLDEMSIEHEDKIEYYEDEFESAIKYGVQEHDVFQMGRVKDVSKIDFQKLKEKILGTFTSPKESDIKITTKYDPNEPEKSEESESDDEDGRKLDEQEAAGKNTAPNPRSQDYNGYIPFGPSDYSESDPEDDDDKIPF